MYPKILDFRPVTMATFTMSLSRVCICPMVRLCYQELNLEIFCVSREILSMIGDIWGIGFMVEETMYTQYLHPPNHKANSIYDSFTRTQTTVWLPLEGFAGGEAYLHQWWNFLPQPIHRFMHIFCLILEAKVLWLRWLFSSFREIKSILFNKNAFIICLKHFANLRNIENRTERWKAVSQRTSAKHIIDRNSVEKNSRGRLNLKGFEICWFGTFFF